MKKVLFLLVFFASITVVLAQDCKMFFPSEEGTQMEITNYDKNDKVTGKTVQHILKREEEGDKLSVTVNHESFDKKDEKVADGEFTVTCEDGVFYMDMRNYIDDEALAAYKNVEIAVDASNMSFNSDVEVGDKLPDASITIKASSSGVNMFTMTVMITNREVTGLEEISTPAGTFNCLKITYDIETKMLVKVQAKAVEWIAEDVGVVKSESYNKNGKLQGYSLLTALNQ